jgi:hypothetical protein
MIRNLRRRMERVELQVSEKRTLMRERVERIARRMGADLATSEIEDMAARLVGTTGRIQAWHRAGLTDVQILERLEHERDGGAL